jgi:hypothetical protein
MDDRANLQTVPHVGLTGGKSMRRLTHVLIAAAAAAALLVSATAQAAAPAGGTLSKSKRSLTWNGGPFTTSYPISSAAPCLNGASDTMCDHFLLKVNMGQGARIKVSIVPSTSGLEVLQVVAGPNDYDMYLFDPQGNQVGESAGSTGRETITFTHKAKFRNKAYEVRVIPFLLVPGATYKGTATTLSYVK